MGRTGVYASLVANLPDLCSEASLHRGQYRGVVGPGEVSGAYVWTYLSHGRVNGRADLMGDQDCLCGRGHRSPSIRLCASQPANTVNFFDVTPKRLFEKNPVPKKVKKRGVGKFGFSVGTSRQLPLLPEEVKQRVPADILGPSGMSKGVEPWHGQLLEGNTEPVIGIWPEGICAP